MARPRGAIRESWMQIEMSRVSGDEDAAALEEALQRVLSDVRGPSRTGRRCTPW